MFQQTRNKQSHLPRSQAEGCGRNDEHEIRRFLRSVVIHLFDAEFLDRNAFTRRHKERPDIGTASHQVGGFQEFFQRVVTSERHLSVRL